MRKKYKSTLQMVWDLSDSLLFKIEFTIQLFFRKLWKKICEPFKKKYKCLPGGECLKYPIKSTIKWRNK